MALHDENMDIIYSGDGLVPSNCLNHYRFVINGESYIVSLKYTAIQTDSTAVSHKPAYHACVRIKQKAHWLGGHAQINLIQVT